MTKRIIHYGSLVFACLLISLTTSGRAADSLNTVLSPHAQDLVILKGDQLVPFQADPFLKAPYTVLYFGAGWCPDCRRFSPSLVEAYGKQDQQNPRFEVLLLSVDKNAEGMLKYIQSEKMPWPALAFEKLAGATDLKKFYSGHGYPCLTVIDPQGKILLQSKSDQDAKEILKQLIALTRPSGSPAGKTSTTSASAPANPADHLPPHISRITWFGERADWSHDGKPLLFLSKTFGDAMEIHGRSGSGVRHLPLQPTDVSSTDTLMPLSRLRSLILHAKMRLQTAFSI